jgi:predicted alpha/beta hydrolase family esterase
MPTVLFVQGAGENTHGEWDNKLVASLAAELGTEYSIRYPRMPNEADPHFAPWRDVIRAELEKLGDTAILVGHSLGATFLIATLAELTPPRRFAGLFLIAPPYVGRGGWDGSEMPDPQEWAGNLDASMPITLFHGDADAIVPPDHAALYAAAIPHLQVRTVAGADHQLGNDLSLVASAIEDARR